MVKESGPERHLLQPTSTGKRSTATNFAEGAESDEPLPPGATPAPLDFSDVFALANVPGISAARESNLLVISQESGEVVNVNRAGHVNSRSPISPNRPTRSPSPT